MILAPRIVKLSTRSGIDIQRTLPHRYIRTIGAWCFVDHFGPTTQENAMSVAAHPHVGLQTVSWLFNGEVEHRDSLGSIQVINPGELNLMTAGNGVAHSELSLPSAAIMHGVQLWTVLPNSVRECAPMFDHYPQLPTFNEGKFSGKLMIGEYLGLRSPARVFTELVGVELNIAADSLVEVPFRKDFEYGVLLASGDLAINQAELPLHHLNYIPPGSQSAHMSSTNGAKIVLLGGVPFQEEIIMWWNFIGRSHEDIVKMRTDWNGHSDRFSDFADQIHGRIPAPVLPNVRLHPRRNIFPTLN